MVVCHVVRQPTRCSLVVVMQVLMRMWKIAIVVDRSGRPAEVVPVQIRGVLLLSVQVVRQVNTVLCVNRCQTTSEVREVVLGKSKNDR